MFKSLVLILSLTISYSFAVDPFTSSPNSPPQQQPGFGTGPTDPPSSSQQQNILPISQPHPQQPQQSSQDQHQFQTRDIPATDSPQQQQQQQGQDGNQSSSSTTLNPIPSYIGNQPAQDERIQNNSDFCTKNYEPVCGSNGQTFSNNCMLNLARKTNSGLTVVRNGEC